VAPLVPTHKPAISRPPTKGKNSNSSNRLRHCNYYTSLLLTLAVHKVNRVPDAIVWVAHTAAWGQHATLLLALQRHCHLLCSEAQVLGLLAGPHYLAAKRRQETKPLQTQRHSNQQEHMYPSASFKPERNPMTVCVCVCVRISLSLCHSLCAPLGRPCFYGECAAEDVGQQTGSAAITHGSCLWNTGKTTATCLHVDIHSGLLSASARKTLHGSSTGRLHTIGASTSVATSPVLCIPCLETVTPV